MTDQGTPPAFYLFAIFLVLKLTHYIDWSWWWVCAPLIFQLLAQSAVVLYVTWRRM